MVGLLILKQMYNGEQESNRLLITSKVIAEWREITYKREIGDQINAILAANVFNFRSWMRKAMEKIIFVINYLQIVRQWWSQKPLEAICAEMFQRRNLD